MDKRIVVALCMVGALLAGGARAEQFFEGCTDTRARPVAMDEDFALPVLARPAAGPQGALLQHNPLLLAQAPEALRLYVYARACAPIALGLGTAELAPKAAREADCWAARTLAAAGGVSGEALDQQWQQLAPELRSEAGPAPQAALASCAPPPASGQLRLPAASAAPTPAWNACVQGCASSLLSCGRSTGCQQSFEHCRTRCDAH